MGLAEKVLALYLEQDRVTVQTFLFQVKRELLASIASGLEAGTIEEASSARGGITHRKVGNDDNGQ